MNGDWFYMAEYDNFGDSRKATPRSPPDNLTQWITQFKGFMKKGIRKVSRSVQAHV